MPLGMRMQYSRTQCASAWALSGGGSCIPFSNMVAVVVVLFTCYVHINLISEWVDNFRSSVVFLHHRICILIEVLKTRMCLRILAVIVVSMGAPVGTMAGLLQFLFCFE